MVMRHVRVLAMPGTPEPETTYYVRRDNGTYDIYVVGKDGAVKEEGDATHAARTDNPHGVTAAQAGAATPSDVATAVSSEATARASADAALASAVAGKSDLGHGHVIGDVTGLQTALDGKEASGTAASLIAAAIGVAVQAYHATLDALAAVSTTVFGRSLLGLASAAALRTAVALPTATTVGRLARYTGTAGEQGETAGLSADASGNVTGLTFNATDVVGGFKLNGNVVLGYTGGHFDWCIRHPSVLISFEEFPAGKVVAP